MLAPLMLALACGTSPPAAAAPPPQSLPLDAGPASMAQELMSTMPLMSSLPPERDSGAADAADAGGADDAMTPIVVDCEGAAAAPMLAAADCASYWAAEMIGTCDMPHA